MITKNTLWIIPKICKTLFCLLCISLRKKCPYSELFWLVFFPHFPVFPAFTTYLPYSVQLGENAGKMRTRITPNTDTFYAVYGPPSGYNSLISFFSKFQKQRILISLEWSRVLKFGFTKYMLVFVYMHVITHLHLTKPSISK